MPEIFLRDCIQDYLSADNLDGSVMLDIAVIAFSREAVEISTLRHILGIPEVLVARDVFLVVDSRAPLVVNIQLVDGVTHAVDKVLDDEPVINAVTVW